jgi:hypothetical protein
MSTKMNSVSALGVLALAAQLYPQTRDVFPWDEMFERPLVRWALQIGEAKSLPWGDPRSWKAGAQDYDIDRVPADAQALLTPETPVLARMETLRRVVALYGQSLPAMRRA